MNKISLQVAGKEEINMCSRIQIILIALLMCGLFCTSYTHAATINAASCSASDISAAISTAVDGDTVVVPAGDCTWAGSVSINKKIKVVGNGMDSTYIRNGSTRHTMRIQSSNATIQGFTFDCNHLDTSNAGIVMVGLHEVLPPEQYGDWRITGNKFINCGSATTWVTGYSAISVRGFVWGVIDHNDFENCSGECIDYCSNYQTSLTKSNDFGQYTNGTIFIEDNVFNQTDGSHNSENIVDQNSGSRVTFRYNTINISNGAAWGDAIYSSHETCATCTGGTADVGTLVSEFYNNTINNNSTSNTKALVRHRAGRDLVYNNTITGTGKILYAEYVSNYRSFNYGNCGGASNGRGLSAWCHDPQSPYSTEGLQSSITTLSGPIGSGDTTLTLASVAGISANGVAYGNAIMIDGEVIEWTGMSGNQLTGLLRGRIQTIAAAHASGAAVNYLTFGQCDDEPNSTWVWGNTINNVAVENETSSSTHLNYTNWDIQSYAQRPNNWQYRNDGTAYSYTPYPYPHPVVSGNPLPTVKRPDPPLSLSVN